MQRYKTRAIVLARTDFGEADRIITFITPDYGKVKAMAKGARKSRSKLAGALEVFSVSQILVLPGKSDISTVMSAKLERHYSSIVKNLEFTNLAYEFLRLINKATPEKPEMAFFDLLDGALSGLNDEIDLEICELWFKAQLLKLTGHSPNLRRDIKGQKLAAAKAYNFNYDKMRFYPGTKGKFSANDVKFLRLTLAAANPSVLAKVTSGIELASKNLTLVNAMLQAHLQI